MSFLDCGGPNSTKVQPTIPELMGKVRLYTGVLKLTCDALQATAQSNGLNGCCGQSFGIIRLITPPLNALLSRLFMAGNHHPWSGMIFSRPTTNFELEELLRQRDEVLGELRDHLMLAQNRMKKVADGHRCDAVFEVGDAVYLKLCPYR